MPHLPVDLIRRIRVPAYLVVAYLSLGLVVEVLISAWPPHIHDLNWRLRALNAAAGATGTELLALLILIAVGQLSMSVADLWVGFWYSLAIASAYLGVGVMFALDALQLRARIPSEQLNKFDVTVGWALARFGVTGFVCLLLAASALSAVHVRRRQAARDDANRLIVGTRAAPAAPAHADA